MDWYSISNTAIPRSRASASFLRGFTNTGQDALHARGFGISVLLILYVEIVHDLGDLPDRLVPDPEGFYEHLEGAELADVGKFGAAYVEGHYPSVEPCDFMLLDEEE